MRRNITVKKIGSIAITTALVTTMLTGCGAKEEMEISKSDNMIVSDTNGSQKQSAEAPYVLQGYQQNNAMERFVREEATDSISDGYPAAEPEERSGIPFNTEEYNALDETGFQSVANHPLSTFSIDVDTASYSNIRRMINYGYIDPGAVRIEEMINYFSYDYETPTGDEPFAVNTEFADCPWNNDTKLLLVGLQTEKIDFSETSDSNLVFLIDVSGSMMAEDKLPLVQKSFTLLTENLTEKDRISIVTYAGSDMVVLEGAHGDQKGDIIEAINQLEAGGGTAGSEGIKTAYKIAQKYFIEGGNNRVILATDGDLNVGITSESALEDLITEKKESGVFLSVLGFGTGNIKDNKMEILADKGNGNYSYIDSINEARKVLVEEMGATLVTVASDVKLQLEFNPANVKGYRLIGYENRMLNSEDFEDDTKDAGEIGAGHSVTALYEVVLNDSKIEIPTTNLKYQDSSNNHPAVNAEDLLTVNIRYKKPGESTSKLTAVSIPMSSYENKMSANLCFASAVAQFGMILRDSKYKGTATYESLLDQLSSCDLSRDMYRQEFVEIVKAASNIE